MNAQADPQPAKPGQPSRTPQETPPPTPDFDRPHPDSVPSETPSPGPDIDQPSPGTEPSPTPTSPIGAGVAPPPG